MGPAGRPEDREPFLVDGNDATAVVVDAGGTVVSGTTGAEWLVGRRLDLPAVSVAPLDADGGCTGTTTLTPPSGRPERYRYSARALAPADAVDRTWLVLLAPVDRPSAYEAARERADGHARLAHAAAVSIGSSLDLQETAERLAQVLVPDFADMVTVDIPRTVLQTDEPPESEAAVLTLRRAAAVTADGTWPSDLAAVGEPLPAIPEPPELKQLAAGTVVAVSDMPAFRAELGLDRHDTGLVVPTSAHALLAAPLLARGRMLGVLGAWRTDNPDPFDEQDAELLVQIASRGALGLDNARRYAREHRTAVALQRSLLPPHATNTSATETAGTYVPAEGDAGVGGDWYDVLALSSLRTAFVVGDVVGHGLNATAAMGRLRTAVQTLADLDLEPGELLGRLDDLVLNYWLEHDPDQPASELAAVGATVLYAVYDPVTARCALASAGHFPPIVLRPGRDPEFVDMSTGPPLGVGGMPFESVEIDLPPGSLLAFYTDGLVERRDTDVGWGMAELADALARNRTAPLAAIGPEVLARLAPPNSDDIALLLATTRAVPAESVADWELPADPSVVARARELTAGKLAEWGLEDLAFTTELVVSELVTNAIRYGGAPIGLRLIRDEVLVCEVSDASNTQPRLRRAIATDEGGRGLFLVAQMTSRWGSRYRRSGKTIWTEQRLDASEAAFGDALLDAFGDGQDF